MKRISTLALIGILSGCASQQAKAPEPPKVDPNQAAVIELMRNFSRVNFEFDSSLITPGTADALAANVRIMKHFPDVSIEVEGHCDERGSTEYNLVLGHRRAESIKKYMVTAGIDAQRVATISFGEERPLVDGADGDTWLRNRRAEFRVTVGGKTWVEGTVANQWWIGEPVAATR